MDDWLLARSIRLELGDRPLAQLFWRVKGAGDRFYRSGSAADPVPRALPGLRPSLEVIRTNATPSEGAFQHVVHDVALTVPLNGGFWLIAVRPASRDGTARSQCAACGTRRHSRLCEIVDNAEATRTVGKTCLERFLGAGCAPPTSLWGSSDGDHEARRLSEDEGQTLRKLVDLVEKIECFSAYPNPPRPATDAFVIWAAAARRQFGWASRRDSRQVSTASRAYEAMSLQERGDQPPFRPVLADHALARRALAWARSLPAPNPARDGYLDALSAAVRRRFVPYRSLGVVASLINAHAKATGGRLFDPHTMSRSTMTRPQA